MAAAGVPARSTKTVLIVEDNAIAWEGMAVVLFRHGYHALTAGHGREALELLASGPTPDLILLDRLMPVLDGWKLLDRLKAGRYSAIPVVITTGTILTPEWAPCPAESPRAAGGLGTVPPVTHGGDRWRSATRG